MSLLSAQATHNLSAAYTAAGIALGSNLGDRLANLRAARCALAKLAIPDAPILSAPVYLSDPVGCAADAPKFFNTVVEIRYHGSPQELLEATTEIERRLGRENSAQRNAPRQIDLDLLYFGEKILNDQNLILPHPRMAVRAFVMQPLSDIRPRLVLPGMKETVKQRQEILCSQTSGISLARVVW